MIKSFRQFRRQHRNGQSGMAVLMIAILISVVIGIYLAIENRNMDTRSKVYRFMKTRQNNRRA